MPVNLTQGAIDKAAAAVASSRQRKDLCDARFPGLRLRLTPAGSATWVLAMRDREGRMRRFRLGTYEKTKGMGLAEARDAARAMHVQIKGGGPDPTAERRKARAIGRDAKEGIGTLAGLIDLYETKRASKLRSWKQQRQAIEHVFAAHLERPLATMAVTDLRVTASNHKAVYTAALAVRCLRPILKWAEHLGYAPGGLTDIKPPAIVQRRERILSPDELAALLPVLRGSGRPYAGALFMMLGTLARREEVCGARWREIDLDTGVWTIAKERTKNGKGHTVALPGQMVTFLRSLLPTGGSKPPASALIFSTSTGAPLGNWDRETKKLAKLSGTADWTRHDLRRTGATILGRAGIGPHVIEAALNHATIHSKLAGIYNQSRYEPEVADALQLLADKLECIEQSTSVVCNDYDELTTPDACDGS